MKDSAQLHRINYRFFVRKKIIQPAEQRELNYWANKWRINSNDLRNAILDTGYVSTDRLKNHLENKGVLLFSWRGLVLQVKKYVYTKRKKLSDFFEVYH